MRVISIRTPGLGDTTYLLEHEGEGIVVDPQRDIDRFLATASDLNARVRYVLETHVHNDYVSGGRDLARETGAELVLPAAAVVAFDHTPAFHLEEFGTERFAIRPLHTPGHTPEHVSYLILIDGSPAALFSGGSLLVGAAGRSDLLGPERAWQLAVAQYHSVRRLAQLPDEVGLYPTHGEGSFCTAGGAGRSTSTIGEEKRLNPVLRHTDLRAFAQSQLTGLAPHPRYYRHMGPINLLGPTPLPDPHVPELTPAEVQALGEVQVVDARPRDRLAAGHLPRATAIPLAADFGTWAGWVLPFNAPLVLVLDPDQDAVEAVTQLGRIGFDRVLGVLRGVDAWRTAGHPLASFRTVGVEQFAAAVEHGEAQVLDVRAPSEWEAGHLPGSFHRYLPDIVDGVPEALDRTRPVWVGCAGGYRATVAASLLARRGYTPVLLIKGGIPDVMERLPAAAGA